MNEEKTLYEVQSEAVKNFYKRQRNELRIVEAKQLAELKANHISRGLPLESNL